MGTRTKTTWRLEFLKASTNDMSRVVAVAPSEELLDIEFDPGYGGSEGQPILIWTEERVYFPVVYDGAEWMEWVPRNPGTEGKEHVGGQ